MQSCQSCYLELATLAKSRRLVTFRYFACEDAVVAGRKRICCVSEHVSTRRIFGSFTAPIILVLAVLGLSKCDRSSGCFPFEG
ncbi:hypothetical protein V5799_010310 [Amblyomma americanum]|uniref:Uncharacterized protein n=1 Tax=Amblyomma americanum TaxID=6943 RepID=A0AAQ4F9G1_AMBAM